MPSNADSSQQALASVNAKVSQALQQPFAQAAEQIQAAFLEFRRAIAQAPERIRASWTAAVALGWFPTSQTSCVIDDALEQGPDAVDEAMISELQQGGSELKAELISAYPLRRHIMECAIQLHEEGNYIASVPLFLAQADGICAEKLGAHYFTDKTAGMPD